MKRIIYNKSGAGYITEQYVICEEPTAGTFGDYILMKFDLKEQDIDTTWMKDIILSNKYLRYIRNKHGELHCEKCGAAKLRIKRIKTKEHKRTASVDHWFPKSKYPSLQTEFGNLRVMCVKCIHRKNDKIIKKEELKFLYPEENRVW